MARNRPTRRDRLRLRQPSRGGAREWASEAWPDDYDPPKPKHLPWYHPETDCPDGWVVRGLPSGIALFEVDSGQPGTPLQSALEQRAAARGGEDLELAHSLLVRSRLASALAAQWSRRSDLDPSSPLDEAVWLDELWRSLPATARFDRLQPYERLFPYGTWWFVLAPFGAATLSAQDYPRFDLAPEGPDDPHPAGEARWLCRPLSKTDEFRRVPVALRGGASEATLRCLSPHHTAYGVFDELRQRTLARVVVLEAWAVDEAGRRVPSLLLESVDASEDASLAVVGRTLLAALGAVAHSRGLSERRLIGEQLLDFFERMDASHGGDLGSCRRDPVALEPADPLLWHARRWVHRGEGWLALRHPGTEGHACVRLPPFAEFAPRLAPANRAEVLRLADLPVKMPVPVVRAGDQVVGFISSWPDPSP